MELLTCALLFIFTYATIQALLHSLLARPTKNSNNKNNLPPGPPGLPIIGNLLELGQKPHQSMANLAKTYGTLMSLKLGQVTTVVISSAELAKQVLQTHDHFFSNRTIPQSVQVLNHENFSLAFMPISPLWRELRKICNNQLFAHKALDESQAVRRERVQQLLHDVDRCCRSGEAIDVGTEAFKITMNLLSNTIFSEDFARSSGSAGEFKEVVTNITKLVGSPNIADFFGVLRVIDPQGVRRKQSKNVAELFEIFDRVIRKRVEARESMASNNTRHSDMLDALLNISKENHIMDTSMIQHLAHDLLVAGTDTTSSTLEWALSELVRNPEVMQKAKKEVEEIIGKGKAIEESDIPRLPYLQAILKETFRLHPPVPLLLPRKAERDVEICNFTIPKDAQVIVNVYTIGRDPTLWDNPNLFSPDRFIGSDVDIKGHHFELAPFGAGRRICPGMMLAIRMLHLMLGSLINTFDWKLEDGMKPEDMDMNEKFGITLQKAQPLRIVPVCISIN